MKCEYSSFEVDAIASSYYSVWRLAEKTCKISYSGSLGEGCRGAYWAADDQARRQIYIVNEGLAGRRDPHIQDADRMKKDILTIAHELGHATNHQASVGTAGDRLFKRSLSLWLSAKMDGTILRDEERSAIYMEEVRAETFGKALIEQIHPSLSFEYDCAVVDNLSAYSSLLWTGKWPDGSSATGLTSEGIVKACEK